MPNERHAQERRRPDLPLRIGFQRQRASAVQRSVEKKVQRIQMPQLESLDFPFDHSSEVSRDILAGDELLEDLVPPRLQRDDADVGGIALDARPRVRDIDETHLHVTIATFVRTTVLSTSAGQ